MSYQQPWGTDRSPLSELTTAGNRNPPKNPSNNGSLVSAGDTSFKTNVNRNKTQRWVQAPSYSYDGDDWGEADEYNEYGPQEPHQSPSPLSTGPRRDVQAIESPAGVPKGYGALTDHNPTSGGAHVRNTTQPMMARPNSFDKGDDKRAYSAGVGAHPGTMQPQAPPINTSRLPPAAHISGTKTVDTPKTLTPVQSDAKTRAPGTPIQFNNGSQEASNTAEPTSQSSTKDSAERTSFPTRDASLIGPSHKSSPKESPLVEGRNAPGVTASAIAQTSQTRSPAGAADSPGGGRFPPRKSSLSQDVPPYDVSQSVAQVQNHPSQGSEDRARSSSNPSKPLQIIRPSDIYKRVNEERERERQSLESVRPSMEAITGTQSTQIDHVAKEQDVREESSRRNLSPLEPVQERKSEYGFDGFTAERPPPLQTSSNNATTSRQAESEPLSAKPKLPDVPRLSGFGDDFFNLGSSTTTKINDPIDKGHEGSSTISNSQRTPLQHQHSKGFRSVVEQAFDKTVDDKSVPPTPSSGYHSQVESIKRTDSESTSGISPIMSRFSSTATAATKARDAELHRTATPAIAEEISDVPEFYTSGKTPLKNPQSAGIAARKPSPAPASQNTSSDSLPQAFKPGHRRDLSTPSPNNSPARSPELEINKPLAAGQDPKVAKVITVEDGKSSSGSPALSPNESEARDAAGSLSTTHGGLGPSSSYFKDSPAITQGPVDNLARPGTERLESFRPLLPGGWVSYATTPEGANTPNPTESEKERATRGLEQPAATSGTFVKDGSVKPNSLDPTHTINDSQLASLEAAHRDQPITPLPENPYSNTGVDPRLYSTTASTVRATANDQPERSVSGVLHERNQPKNPAVTGASAVIPPGVLTPMTDLGDSRKPSVIDAKIGGDLPKSGQPSSSENVGSLSARPLQVQKTISSSSSVPPTPPPKDTPLALSGAVHPTEYFPPAQNLATSQQQSSRAPQPARIKPQLLPALSTETSPNDQESDRLRKEIVRSLSPQSSSAKDSFSAAFDDNKPDRTKSDASQIIGQSRESTFLPSEYESYWATTSEPSEAIPAQSQNVQARDAAAGPAEATLFRPDLVSELQLGEAGHANAPGPLLPDKIAHEPRPGVIKNRFSWETETDLSPSTPADVYNRPAMPTMPINVPSKEQSTQSKASPPYSNPSNTAAVSGSSLPNSQDRAPAASSPQGQEGGLLRLAKQQPIGEGLEHIGDVEGDKEPASDRVVPVEGRSVPEIKGFHELSGEPGEREFSDPTETSLQHTGGVSSEPSEFHGAKPFTSGSSITSSANASLPFVTGSQNMAVDVPSFRQILAMKSPSDRILTYNSSRAHFANEPSGLNYWMAQVVSQTPEHRTLFAKSADGREGNWNLPGASTGVMPSGSGAHSGDISSTQPMAQPYYQQYVQAANSPTSPPGSAPPKQYPAGPPSGSQGFSPSGNKLSTQQVQAKGKDLLHTAGVFSGKANHAAKGLFAKGRSKFRGSGGGDKVEH
ncbi:MAG: hypothetical protein M1824_000756 [Vezdaea acicularis]|nr:MAG: hypothetical protein M1824_000756 [Vezdaea acicularis]